MAWRRCRNLPRAGDDAIGPRGSASGCGFRRWRCRDHSVGEPYKNAIAAVLIKPVERTSWKRCTAFQTLRLRGRSGEPVTIRLPKPRSQHLMPGSLRPCRALLSSTRCRIDTQQSVQQCQTLGDRRAIWRIGGCLRQRHPPGIPSRGKVVGAKLRHAKEEIGSGIGGLQLPCAVEGEAGCGRQLPVVPGQSRRRAQSTAARSSATVRMPPSIASTSYRGYHPAKARRPP